MVWQRGKCAGGLSRDVRRAKGRPERGEEHRADRVAFARHECLAYEKW